MIERFLGERSTAVVAALAIGVGGIATGGCANGVNTTERTVTVCDKETVRVGTGDTESNEPRVYTADADGRSHAYRVVNTMIVGGVRFDAAEVFGSLTEGRTYDITSSGFRIGIADQFPNIIDVQRVDPDHPEWC